MDLASYAGVVDRPADPSLRVVKVRWGAVADGDADLEVVLVAVDADEGSGFAGQEAGGGEQRVGEVGDLDIDRQADGVRGCGDRRRDAPGSAPPACSP